MANAAIYVLAVLVFLFGVLGMLGLLSRATEKVPWSRESATLVSAVTILALAVTAAIAIVYSGLNQRPMDSTAAAAITGIATIVLAVVGAVSIVFNIVQVRGAQDASVETRKVIEQNRALIAATEKLGTAANNTLAEMQRQREQDWQPYLVLQDEHEHSGRPPQPGTPVTTDVSQFWCVNIGKGPALNCRLCVVTNERTGTRDKVTELFSLAPGESIVSRQLDPTNNWWQTIVQGLQPYSIEGNATVVCNDQFGNYLRFTRGIPKPDFAKANSQPIWAPWYY